MAKTSWHGEREPYRCGVSTDQNSARAEVGGGMPCVVMVGVAVVAGGRGSQVGLGFRVFHAVRPVSSFFDICRYVWLASGKRKIRAAEPKRIQIEIPASDGTKPIQSEKNTKWNKCVGTWEQRKETEPEPVGRSTPPPADNAKRDDAMVISTPPMTVLILFPQHQ